jgi:3-hydroxyisobutyrate dehydrogenase-like beta-hydroxyacid dehydrogenase
MKLVVNTLLGVGMQSIAEAAALGRALGIERDLLFDTLAKTAVIAPAHLEKLATPKVNDDAAQFPVRVVGAAWLCLGEADAAEIANSLRVVESEAAAEKNVATILRAA